MSTKDNIKHDNKDAINIFVLPECWVNGQAQAAGFTVTPETLYKLLESRDVNEYEKLGCISGVAAKLSSNLDSGLSDATDDSNNNTLIRKQLYGTNIPPSFPRKNYLQFLLNSFTDKMLLILCVTALVQTGIGIYNLIVLNDSDSLYDGSSTFVVVILVTLITSINDYKKQEKFRKLNDCSVSLSHSKVIRSNSIKIIQTTELLVGDILFMSQGMIVPADGLLIESNSLKFNESALTGESKDIHKSVDNDPFIVGGTSVLEGYGKILVTAVSKNSLHGRIILTLNEAPIKTPLQMKLSALTELIVKMGICIVVMFLIIIIIAHFTLKKTTSPSSSSNSQDIINLFLIGLSVLIIAVPEGLPLSVTLALAYAAIYMIKEKCLVRNLASCETMGCSSAICTDKTGTLTMNTMSVTSCHIFNITVDQVDTATLNSLNNSLLPFVCAAVNVNSNATKTIDHEKNEVHYSGSRTECALIKFTELLNHPYDQYRTESTQIAVKPFSSAHKYSAVVFNTKNAALNKLISSIPWPNITFKEECIPPLVCVTGAPDIVLGACTHYIDSNGNVKKLDTVQSNMFYSIASTYANNALRTIAVAVKAGESTLTADSFSDYNYLNNLIICTLFGISDPLRPEVPDAISKCHRAGIVVRMITGDSLETARAISKKCGIIKCADDIAIEGKVFREMSNRQLRSILPRLRVLARSSPMDKRRLVKLIKDTGEIVSVTGDGTNDTPALKKADIGLAMGSESTDMAKRASDIIILDGNFSSVLKAVLWGRSTLNSIKNFLQFQISVNISAVIITVITSVITSIYTGKIDSVFKVVQLLWINLIMDTLAALSLSTDKPTEALYDRKPSKLNDSIISPCMFTMIIVQAAYQIVICIAIYVISLNSKSISFKLFDVYGNINKNTTTLIFNTFIMCQVFNVINCRSCTRYKNVFNGIFANRFFLPIQFLIIVLQVIITTYGGRIFGVMKGGLGIKYWGISVLLGLFTLPLGYLVRLSNSDSIYKRMFCKKRRVSDILLQSPTPETTTEDIFLEKSGKKLVEKAGIEKLTSEASSIINYNEPGPALDSPTVSTPKGPLDPSQTLDQNIHIETITDQTTAPARTIGSGWQAARRYVMAMRIINAMNGGRLRNEESIFKELNYNHLLFNHDDTKDNDSAGGGKSGT